MNERIEKLAVQAGLISGEFNGFDRMRLTPAEQRFAELIVKECIDVVVDVLPDIVPESKGGIHPAWHIKEHFGVEL